MPDVTIIGGGPAGAGAAIVLARSGWDVTVVEQHRFPRDKVCGECLSGLGIGVLGRLGLGGRVRGAGAVSLVRTILHAPDGAGTALPLPGENWGLSRRRLDALLLDAAREAGAVVRQPVRCEGLAAGPGGVELRTRDLTTNALTTVRPGFVLLADGKAALPGPRPAPTGDFGLKAHFIDVDGPRDAVELFGFRGHYGGAAPVEAQDVSAARAAARWNVALSVPGAVLAAFRGDHDALFASAVGQNRALARQFRRARRAGAWLVSPLPRFAVRTRAPAGAAPMGNAAAALEPIGGEGMGLALRSAELAAGALILAAESGRALDRAALTAEYHALWRVRRLACRAAAWVASRPKLAGAAVRLLAPGLPLSEAALRWVGKEAPRRVPGLAQRGDAPGS